MASRSTHTNAWDSGIPVRDGALDVKPRTRGPSAKISNSRRPDEKCMVTLLYALKTGR